MHQDSTTQDWLDSGEIARIRHGFSAVAANADRFTADFYERLFERAPTLRPLFPEDLSSQRDKLKHMLVMLVASLDCPVALRPALAALGDRHRSYGVVKVDFIAVGQALIDTLDVHLGEQFGPTDRNAWTALYSRIVAIMSVGTAHAAAAA
ncbi:MAG TPA: globin domain-containing protein [Rudaea sp.]|nr:globin domain-containing protein [Rudaea sp.]